MADIWHCNIQCIINYSSNISESTAYAKYDTAGRRMSIGKVHL